MIDSPARAPFPPPAPPPLPPSTPGGHRDGLTTAFMIVMAAICAMLLVGTAVGVDLGLARLRSAHPAVATTAPIRVVPQNPSNSGSAATDSQSVAARVEPALVDINTVVQGGGAAGTGMIVSSDGEVLTNNHVIAGATRISVTLPSTSRTYIATVLGADPAGDVALIKLTGASGLPTVTLADSSTLAVGQPIIAIGNALGRGGPPSVTTGSITALDQAITATDGDGPGEQLSGLIQEDAPISPGDSGGALANTSGQVVGMITAGETRGRGLRRATTSTVGYAITSTTAAGIANQIRAGGFAATAPPASTTGYLGVQVKNLDPTTAAQLGLSSGALVIGVVVGSPAEQAGISADSVITALDGQAVASADALGPLIRAFKPGQTVHVTFVDGSGSHTRTVTLG